MLGLCWENEKKDTTIVSWGYILRMMEKIMETTIVYWGYIGDSGKEN